jgi:Tfp pilus assembly protein PilF
MPAMKRGLGLLVVSLILSGCVAPDHDRVRDYNEDGVHLFRSAEYEDARQSFQVALTLRPEDANLHYNLAQCYDRLGNTTKAEQAYANCLARSPNHGPARHALAGLLVRQGRVEETKRMVEDWLTREPKLSDPYALDGWLWHQTGDLPRAQARLQQALEIDPANPRALTELGLVYEALQRSDRALVLYQRALAQDANQPEIKKRVDFLLTSGTTRPKPE